MADDEKSPMLDINSNDLKKLCAAFTSQSNFNSKNNINKT